MMYIDIHKDVSTKEIYEAMVTGYNWCQENNKGCFLSFSGFAQDPREIYEIPEAIELCRKLISMGFMSILTLFTLIDEDGKPSEPSPSPFGAFEIWATSKGLFDKNGEVGMSAELVGCFYQDLGKSNIICEEYMISCKDGQHRHKGK